MRPETKTREPSSYGKAASSRLKLFVVFFVFALVLVGTLALGNGQAMADGDVEYGRALPKLTFENGRLLVGAPADGGSTSEADTGSSEETDSEPSTDGSGDGLDADWQGATPPTSTTSPPTVG